MDGFAISTIDNATSQPYTIVENLKSLAGAEPKDLKSAQNEKEK